MHTEQNCSNRFLVLLVVGIALFAIASVVHADPPSRVARLAYSTGPVGFSPAGEEEWVEATLNRPLVTGDRLWSDNGARVELSIGTAAIRLGSTTSVTLLNLDDNVAQLRLAQGTLNIRVRRLDANQVIEVDTPNLAYVIRRPGQYRISVDPDGDATEVLTRNGQADVYGEGASYVVASGRVYRFYGTGLREYELLALPGIDEFDRWAQDRDRRYDRSASYRYVSRDVIGAQDLDEYGAWRTVPEYGNVWMPTRVATGWAPYRDGHWAWVDPWGWTWIDDAPWGFAVSHYGRWANFDGRWGWIPGPVAARAVYAPALVAFVGGSNFQISVATGGGAVGWFPLGPRNVYRPAYAASRAYFTNVNTSNTVISNTYVTNVYNNRNVTNVTYVNQQVPGAVVAVPAAAFVQSQPVARAAIVLPRDAAMRAPVSAVAAVAPQQISVRGAAAQGAKPPPQVMERPVIARSAPPPAPVAFAARERTLAAQPGRPVDPSALAGMRAAKPMPEPKIEVVTGNRSATPQAAPPPQSAQQTMQRRDERRAQSPATAPNARSAESTPTPQTPITQPVRPGQAAPARPAPPATSPLTQPVRPTQPAPPAQVPAVVPPGQGLPRAMPPQATPQAAPEQRGNAEQRRQQDVPPASGRPPQAATPPPAPARPMQPAASPAAAPQDTRGRGQPAPAAVTPPPVAAPPVVAPPAAVQPPRPTIAPAPPAAAEQRGRPDARGAPPPAAQPAPAATPLPRAAPEPARRAEPAQPPKAAPGVPAPAAPVALPPATSPPPATMMQRGPRGNVPAQPTDKKADDDKDDDKKRK